MERSDSLNKNELVMPHDFILEEGSDHADQDEIHIEAQHQEYMSLKSSTTFRDDVRNEWIHAVFGTTFPQCMETASKPRRGMGLAQIAPYTAYTATIPGGVTTDKMLGLSISRLSLGLYVRHVELGSEAWCAGIVPNSVLVSINGMSLLAEPSKLALERLWQYEGHLHLEQIIQATSASSRQQASKETPVSSTKLARNAASLSNRQPLHLIVIYQGHLRSAVLLSNPPYGIDWAPCGNFALVKRSYAHAHEAGIVKGSIIACINAGKDIHELDHTQAASILRNLYVNRQAIHLTLCIPPSEARSGHFERVLDTKEVNSSSTTTTSKQATPGKIQRPQVAAELDGVEIRVHPILFSAGSPRPSTVSDAAMNLSQLAFRVAAGELFSFPHHGRYQYFFSQRYYRSCPTLDRPLTELLSLNHSLLYLLEYDKVNYDETRLAMGRLLKENENTLVLSYLREQSLKQVHRSVETFLLPILALLRMEEASNDSLSPLSLFIFATCKDHIDLCHRMEFMAQAQGLTHLKDQLMTLRNQRLHQRRQPRQIPIRVERIPDSPVAAASIVTGTTASVMTMSSFVSETNTEEEALPTRGLFGFFRKKKKSWNRKKRLSTNTEPKSKARAITPMKANLAVPSSLIPSALPPRVGITTPRIPKDALFSNTLAFLEELEAVCLDVEKSLLRSFSQKIAAWALQPWSASKETELAQVTQVMRERLRQFSTLPFLNPIDSQAFMAVDAQGSYILPSAHFPLLLTFDCQDRDEEPNRRERRKNVDHVLGMEKLYRTKVELVDLVGKSLKEEEATGRTYLVHCSVGGTIMKSGPSIATNRNADRHAWDQENVLTYDTRSSWGAPCTLSLVLSQSNDTIVASDENGKLLYEKEIGYCFLDMASLWERVGQDDGMKATESFFLKVLPSDGMNKFDQHGDLQGGTPEAVRDEIEVHIKVTLQRVPIIDCGGKGVSWTRKRSLLYKHDDDVRQELFAIDFIKSCDKILKSCGLNLKLLIFRCIPVGNRRGFIEWIHGSVPLSEICQPFAGSILDGNKKDASRPSIRNTTMDLNPEEDPLSSVAKAGLSKYESLRRINSGQLHRKKSSANGCAHTLNQIQDFLRSFHYAPNDPYMIRKSVMETYVKSCAGYCVVTYILGVGDRHLDNLLLHPTGHFFHCDYSFILGHDPKKYLPLRITEDMVNGMGGRGSDNYAMFLSLTCAAFLIFRRPESVRHLMSFVRLMEGCCTLPSSADAKQSLENTMMGMRERLQLDLSDDEAISFMEKLIEESCASRMWIAVDAIHTLGKRF